LLAHYSNALWSIYYGRRNLRLSRWELWQLSLGLGIPLLLMFHVTGTRVAEGLFGGHEPLQLGSGCAMAAIAVAWRVASSGRADRVDPCLYRRSFLAAHQGVVRRLAAATLSEVGLLLPTLALSGYVTAGNQILRAAENPNYAKLSLEAANLTDQKRAEIGRIARMGSAIYLALLLLSVCGPRRGGWLYRQHRRASASLIRADEPYPCCRERRCSKRCARNGIPHASVCGGRARCTTCRILVTKGLRNLSEPDLLYILNQFFDEMIKALNATNGHYSQFTPATG